MIERGSALTFLLIGLLVVVMILTGLNITPSSIGSFYNPVSQSKPPTTSQIETLVKGEALSNLNEVGTSQSGLDATTEEISSVLASETLLLGIDIYNIDLPVIAK